LFAFFSHSISFVHECMHCHFDAVVVVNAYMARSIDRSIKHRSIDRSLHASMNFIEPCIDWLIDRSIDEWMVDRPIDRSLHACVRRLIFSIHACMHVCIHFFAFILYSISFVHACMHSIVHSIFQSHIVNGPTDRSIDGRGLIDRSIDAWSIDRSIDRSIVACVDWFYWTMHWLIDRSIDRSNWMDGRSTDRSIDRSLHAWVS
jgi:hypothetical protein